MLLQRGALQVQQSHVCMQGEVANVLLPSSILLTSLHVFTSLRIIMHAVHWYFPELTFFPSYNSFEDTQSAQWTDNTGTSKNSLDS